MHLGYVHLGSVHPCSVGCSFLVSNVHTQLVIIPRSQVRPRPPLEFTPGNFVRLDSLPGVQCSSTQQSIMPHDRYAETRVTVAASPRVTSSATLHMHWTGQTHKRQKTGERERGERKIKQQTLIIFLTVKGKITRFTKKPT